MAFDFDAASPRLTTAVPDAANSRVRRRAAPSAGLVAAAAVPAAVAGCATRAPWAAVDIGAARGCLSRDL